MLGRYKTWLEIGAVLGGGLLIYGGWKLSVTLLIHLGLLLVSPAVIIFGVDAIRTRVDTYSVGDTEVPQTETYTGFGAVMSGIFMAMIGFAILTYALLALFGLQDRFVTYFATHPGAILLFGGIMLVSFSFTLVLGTLEDRTSFWAMLGSLPARVLGLVLLLVGIGAILLGGLEIVSHASYVSLIDAARTAWPRIPD